MTAPTIRQLIQDVILENGPQTADAEPDARTITNALLASPPLKAIIDLAAYAKIVQGIALESTSPEVRALLADWRASPSREADTMSQAEERAKALRRDWEMVDFPHRVLRNDVVTLLEQIERLRAERKAS